MLCPSPYFFSANTANGTPHKVRRCLFETLTSLISCFAELAGAKLCQSQFYGRLKFDKKKKAERGDRCVSPETRLANACLAERTAESEAVELSNIFG